MNIMKEIKKNNNYNIEDNNIQNNECLKNLENFLKSKLESQQNNKYCTVVKKSDINYFAQCENCHSKVFDKFKHYSVVKNGDQLLFVNTWLYYASLYF